MRPRSTWPCSPSWTERGVSEHMRTEDAGEARDRHSLCLAVSGFVRPKTVSHTRAAGLLRVYETSGRSCYSLAVQCTCDTKSRPTSVSSAQHKTPRLFMGATVYAAFCNACPGLHRRDSSRHHAVLVTTSVVVGTSILGLIVCGREPKKPIPPAQPANQSPP